MTKVERLAVTKGGRNDKVDRNDKSCCHREERSDVAVSATAGVLTMGRLPRHFVPRNDRIRTRNDRIRGRNDKLELSIVGGGRL